MKKRVFVLIVLIISMLPLSVVEARTEVGSGTNQYGDGSQQYSIRVKLGKLNFKKFAENDYRTITKNIYYPAKFEDTPLITANINAGEIYGIANRVVNTDYVNFRIYSSADISHMDLDLNLKAESMSNVEKTGSRNAPEPIKTDTYDNSGQTTHPSVLYFKNGKSGYKYWMANTPYTNTNEKVENPSIIVSNDGENFIKHPKLKNPLDSPEEDAFKKFGAITTHHMSDTDLIYANGRFELYYRYRARGQTERIYRKTSKDGINWSARETVLSTIDKTGDRFLSPSVLFEDGKYKIYYVEKDVVFSQESLTGRNGSWGNKQKVNLSYNTKNIKPWHLSVYKERDDKYYLLLNAIKNNDYKDRVLAVGQSRDGKAFSNIKTIVEKSKSGFDSYYIYRASMIKKENGVYQLYYSARDKNNRWRIGKLEGASPYQLFY